MLGMSERSFRRYRRRYEDDGLDGLFDRRLDKASARRVPCDQVAWVLEQYRTRHVGWTVKHFHDHLCAHHGFAWSYTWTKTTLQRAGLVPEHPDVPLWLVVVRGLGETPMMLLTNLSLRKNRKVLWWVVSAYLTRWRVEEAIRFIKQSYDFEDIRVLTYERLPNMAVLVNAVAFFTAVVLGARIKLHILAGPLLKAAKRLFGISDFCRYALADGIREVCARSPRRSQPGAKDPPQLTLGFG